MLFPAYQRESAIAQMRALGVPRPGVGYQWINAADLAARGVGIDAIYDGRLVRCFQENLRRIALYFRWRPELGEILTPDRIFQGVFRSGASADERRCAPYVTIPEDRARTIISVAAQVGNVIDRTEGWSQIFCQHCWQRLPLKAFSTQQLRECEFGE